MPQTPELHDRRALWRAKQVVSLPVALLAAACRLPKRLLQRLQLKSEKELRAADLLRQSRVGRELGGLTPDHNPAVTRPAEKAVGGQPWVRA